jgi:polyphosphate kinase 2 (PPK2 family)
VRVLPERGQIGIFNRSYYEEVLAVRVHPDLLEAQSLPAERVSAKVWEQRFQDIRAFERHLLRSGTVIRKFFLHVSKKEQKKRLLERLDDPDKHWKFSESDVRQRASWSEYMRAYEDMVRETSTEHAPWYVVPADNKWRAWWSPRPSSTRSRSWSSSTRRSPRERRRRSSARATS